MHTGFFLIKLFVLLPEATSFFPGRVKILISYLRSVSFFCICMFVFFPRNFLFLLTTGAQG